MGILETLLWIALQLMGQANEGSQSNESQSNEGVIWEQPPPNQP